MYADAASMRLSSRISAGASPRSTTVARSDGAHPSKYISVTRRVVAPATADEARPIAPERESGETDGAAVGVAARVAAAGPVGVTAPGPAAESAGGSTATETCSTRQRPHVPGVAPSTCAGESSTGVWVQRETRSSTWGLTPTARAIPRLRSFSFAV